jgi:hypothetical protein
VVTTTIDLTVVPNEKGITILYRTSDDLAYAGYWRNYDSEAAKVALPATVRSLAEAYALINEGVAFEILLTPVQRSYAAQGYMDI